jgi:hypothetical protein
MQYFFVVGGQFAQSSRGPAGGQIRREGSSIRSFRHGESRAGTAGFSISFAMPHPSRGYIAAARRFPARFRPIQAAESRQGQACAGVVAIFLLIH